jgi:hypothetical protein
MTDEQRRAIESAIAALNTLGWTHGVPALRALLADGGKGEAVAYTLLAALVDIYDDGMNNAPEDRCYVEGAWKETLDEARAYLAAPQAECARMEFKPVSGNDHMYVHGTQEAIDALKERLAHDYLMLAQAECAPREAMTDERISEIIEEFDGGSWIDGEYRIECKEMMRLARAIEQAAKEKA